MNIDTPIPFSVVDIDTPINLWPTHPAYDPRVQESGVFARGAFFLASEMNIRCLRSCHGSADIGAIRHGRGGW